MMYAKTNTTNVLLTTFDLGSCILDFWFGDDLVIIKSVSLER